MTNYILIDGSYYIFYRYYALMMWWKNAHKDEPIDEPIEKKEFVEKYLHTFSTKINDLIKKLKIIDPSILYFKDCPREQIWRNKYISKYKGTRNYDNFKGGPFFKLTYESDVLKHSGVKKLIYMDELEADDCVALTVKELLKNKENMIYIIASDMDYLQLSNERVQIYNLKYKKLTDSKKWSGNPEKDLFMKIAMGDKSDNIPGVFKKCGPKTAEKFWNDKEKFYKKLEDDVEAKERFERNTKIIDFNEIPQDLIAKFKATYFNI